MVKEYLLSILFHLSDSIIFFNIFLVQVKDYKFFITFMCQRPLYILLWFIRNKNIDFPIIAYPFHIIEQHYFHLSLKLYTRVRIITPSIIISSTISTLVLMMLFVFIPYSSGF
jgi:hypothetical protein